ncbi:ATP-binding protein [Methyloversatilis sp.]|uniref:ATP-binding protein n=1 Tax=Methyloversatilis sp. TaxID=2569862 RepID=UPI002736F3B3|nr:ATP-binding protein [Methyloversatilis sp.]MDP2870566.1 ATP-binding protein [Methyloversatilis sp.]MDP3457577.1 ATP-binding protein [Methyloversatilis sp.]MDP3578417.1 ATP-binding protein [Methyloversatilis sp.]
MSIRLLLLAGSAVILLGVLGSTVWLAVVAGRDEADELFDARLATSARVLDSLMVRQIEHATLNAPLVMDLPAPIRAGARAHERALEAGANMSFSWQLQDWLFGHHDVESSLGHEYETHIAYQIWSEGEEGAAALLARSSSAPAAPFAPLRKGFSDHTLEDGVWRVFVLHSGDVWIQVAERADAREELSAKLGWATGAPLLIGLLIVLLLTGLLIGYGLAPLSELAERISARRPQDDEPLSLTRVPSEIAPVLSALNGLFGRVRSTLERERRFIDSAAHELRTPLAALKIHAQNARRAEDAAQRDASLDHLLAGVSRSVHLTEQMLAHSRAGRQADCVPVSLREVTRDAVAQRRPGCDASGHPLELNLCDTSCMVLADATGLSSMVGNLIDNAQRYAPSGSTIQVALSARGGSAVLTVSDAGPGIPAELRERVFEPYYRIPGSAGSGSGLGLAIVREVVERLGGQIALLDGEGGQGMRVELTIPLLSER